MPRVYKISIESELWKYAQKRGIEKQLRKNIDQILADFHESVTLKPRQPKSSGVYYFRINKQYRAICHIEDGVMKITSISDHQ